MSLRVIQYGRRKTDFSLINDRTGSVAFAPELFELWPETEVLDPWWWKYIPKSNAILIKIREEFLISSEK